MFTGAAVGRVGARIEVGSGVGLSWMGSDVEVGSAVGVEGTLASLGAGIEVGSAVEGAVVPVGLGSVLSGAVTAGGVVGTDFWGEGSRASSGPPHATIIRQTTAIAGSGSCRMRIGFSFRARSCS